MDSGPLWEGHVGEEMAKVAGNTAGGSQNAGPPSDPEDDRPYQANDCGKEGTDVGEVQRARDSRLLQKRKRKATKLCGVTCPIVKNFRLA